MGKFFKILFGIIGGILLLAIITVTIIIIKISDDRDVNNPNVVEDNKPLSRVIDNKLYEGTEDSVSSNEANIVFDEEELEYLLYPILKSIDISSPRIAFTGVNVDVINGEYKIEVSAQFLGMFKTVATANLDFGFENQIFSIKLNELKAGSMSFTSIGKLVIKSINQEEVKKSLKEANILCDIDFDNFIISFTVNNMKEMISSGVDKTNAALFKCLIDTFLTNDELLTLVLGNDNLIGAYIHLGNAKHNPSLHNDLLYNYDYVPINQNVKKLLDNNVIDYDKVSPLYNFLVRGYKSIEDETKAIIDPLDLSIIGITNNSDYEGIINRSDVTLDGYIKGLFKNKSIMETSNILLSGLAIPDDTLNGIFQSLPFVGFSIAYANDDNEIGSIVIEQLIINCLNEKLKIDMVVSVNGLRIVAEVNFTCRDESSNGLRLDGTIEKLYIGSYELTDEQKTLLLEYLSGVIKELDWITINKDEKTMVLDFTDAITSAITENATLRQVINNFVSYQIDTSIEEGYIAIKYSIF
ncbi:hypothetical protein IKQ02_03660 [bacterium]|nr:hypothetical protein [bacterium]